MLADAAGYWRAAGDEKRRSSWYQAIDRLLDELNAQKGHPCNTDSLSCPPKSSGGQSKPQSGDAEPSKNS